MRARNPRARRDKIIGKSQPHGIGKQTKAAWLGQAKGAECRTEGMPLLERLDLPISPSEPSFVKSNFPPPSLIIPCGIPCRSVLCRRLRNPISEDMKLDHKMASRAAGEDIIIQPSSSPKRPAMGHQIPGIVPPSLPTQLGHKVLTA